MAKRAPKETSLPLVVALVFFVLTTIAFGVMWYMQYSDQQAKAEEVKKANAERQAAQGQEADAIRKLRVHKILVGTDEEGDRAAIEAETAGKEKVGSEIKKFREALAKQFTGGVPADVDIWKVQDNGQPDTTPKAGLLSIVGELARAREAAEKAAADERENTKKTIAKLDSLAQAYQAAAKDLKSVAESLPKDFKAKLDEVEKQYEKRKADFAAIEKKSRDQIVQLDDAKNKADRVKNQLQDELATLQQQLVQSSVKQLAEKDTFQFDEPQGKVLRRLSDGIVEIDIGSNARVREGLTFTVLPSDFPDKGRQSRMKTVRVRNERGEFKDEVRFVEKGTLEVIEVVGPDLARARITGEADYIRDGISRGDLLYNSVWRKGSADHIALLGVFDTNGDGTDDIATVVRDMQRMGIVVDAFFDMSKRQWVGQINEQTRFLVVGRYPVQSANDPNRDEKTQLIDAMSKAVQAAQLKGVPDVKYRDFFPRMGYRVKIDVPDDKINQATAPYLKGVSGSDTPPPGN